MPHRALIAAFLLSIAVPASAQDAEMEDEKKAEEKDEKKDKKKKAKKPKLVDELDVGGRLFVRSALQKEEPDTEWRGVTEVELARISLQYRWEMLRVDLEYEIDQSELKDAVMRIRLHNEGATELDVHVGHFKMPFSALQLESRWTLPVANRGLIGEILTDRLQTAGRRVGVDIDGQLEHPLKPKLVIGVFQGLNDDEDPLRLPAEDHFGMNLFARASIEPVDGVEIGVAGGERTGQLLALPATARHRWSAEADVTVDVAAGPGRARAWAEALAGSSWLRGGPSGGATNTIFKGARALAAWRWHGAVQGEPYIEPYALVGVLDPDADFGDDLVTETTAGVTYGRWDVWRVQVEFEAWRMGDDAPVGIANIGVAPANTTTVMLQAGANF